MSIVLNMRYWNIRTQKIFPLYNIMALKSLERTVQDVVLNSAVLYGMDATNLLNSVENIFGSRNELSRALGQATVIEATKFGKNILATTAGVGTPDVRPLDVMIVDYLASAGGLWLMDEVGVSDMIDRQFGVSGVGGAVGGAVTIEAVDTAVRFAKKSGVLNKIEGGLQGVF